MKNTLPQEIQSLLEALILPGTGEPTTDYIRQWFAEDEHRALKDATLQDIFDRVLTEQEPDELTRRKYAELAAKLGLANGEQQTRTRTFRPLGKRTTGRRLLRRVAAVVLPLLALAGAAFLWLDRKPGTQPPEELVAYVTRSDTVGSANEITLPDGSIVWLNESTRIRYTENFAVNRKVELTGEAFFRVVKDETHPFTVAGDKLTVTVLGTEFNFRSYPQEEQTVVSLASGRVEVADGQRNTVLAPMQQLTYANASGEWEIKPFQAALLNRWQNKPLPLPDMPLREALERTAAYFGVAISIPPDLPRREVNTTIRRRDSLEDVLEAFRFLADYGFNYTLENDTLTIYTR